MQDCLSWQPIKQFGMKLPVKNRLLIVRIVEGIMMITCMVFLSSCASVRVSHDQGFNNLKKIKSEKFRGRQVPCTSFTFRLPSLKPNTKHAILQLSLKPNQKDEIRPEINLAINDLNTRTSVSQKVQIRDESLMQATDPSPQNSKATASDVSVNLPGYLPSPVIDYYQQDDQDTGSHKEDDILATIMSGSDIYTDILVNAYSTSIGNSNTDKQLVSNDISPLLSLSSPPENSVYSTLAESPSQSGRRNLAGFVYMMALITGLLALTLHKKMPALTTRISIWSARNPNKARFIIAGLHVILGTEAYILGERLSEAGTGFSDMSRDILLAALFVSALLYPVRTSSAGLFKYSSLRQKTHDLVFILSASLLMVYTGNKKLESEPSLSDLVNGKNRQQQSSLITSADGGNVNQSTVYRPDRLLQDEPPAAQKNQMGKGKKIILTIVAAILFLAAAFGLLYLSCLIYCDGLEVLAFVLGIGGGLLLILLLYWVLKKIHNPAYRRKARTVQA